MAKKVKQEKRQIFDIGAVAQYFALSIIFALLVYGVNFVVRMALEASPTGQCGNGFLTIYEVHNTGAAFNLFANQPEMLISASVLTVLAIVFCVFVFSAKLSSASIAPLGLLTAGISMNTFERITNGYVFDYIQCNFLPDFPVFNTADMMIVIGAICLVFSVFSRR